MAVLARPTVSSGTRYPQQANPLARTTPATRGAATPPMRPAPAKPAAATADRVPPSPRPSNPDHPTAKTRPYRPAVQGSRAGSASKPATETVGGQNKPEAEILFQKYFKSVGPRTYASQLKRANNGNHFLVLTEAKRDEKTDEVRKTRLFLFSEDFIAFFRMLHETAQFIRENPVPDKVRERQERRWNKKKADGRRSLPKR